MKKKDDVTQGKFSIIEKNENGGAKERTPIDLMYNRREPD